MSSHYDWTLGYVFYYWILKESKKERHRVVLIAKQKRSIAKLVPRQKVQRQNVQRQNVQRNKTLRDESPEGKNVWRQNVQRHNVWRRNICGTKVSRHNMSGRTQRPEDNTFGDKISLRTKRLEEKTSRDKAYFWGYFVSAHTRNFLLFKWKNVLNAEEKSTKPMIFCSTYMRKIHKNCSLTLAAHCPAWLSHILSSHLLLNPFSVERGQVCFRMWIISLMEPPRSMRKKRLLPIAAPMSAKCPAMATLGLETNTTIMILHSQVYTSNIQ